MDTKSYLKQARTYEFNAMQARLSGNYDIADRYESMAKMSMIDAANSYTNYKNDYNFNTSERKYNYDQSDIQGILVGSIVVFAILYIGCYFIGHYFI